MGVAGSDAAATGDQPPGNSLAVAQNGPAPPTSSALNAALVLEQMRQLRHVGRDPPRLVFAE